MAKIDFYNILDSEVERIDSIKISKRNEKVIESFSGPTTAIIDGKDVTIFNSNDYLGLRHNSAVKKAEAQASEKYGSGPGAVRFISGTLKIHKDLETSISGFHNREDAIIFSSAFAANLAVMFCLLAGQSKDSKVTGSVLVVSDQLNHRSIIDGIRLANLPSENKTVFEHMNMQSLESILSGNIAKFDRIVVVTDGVFSMLGEIQKLDKVRELCDKYDSNYPLGILLVVDDCHGVAACGNKGRGIEELKNVKADILVGTFGKGFGADGGYVVSDKKIISFFRESAATYIYSNSIAPGTAGAAIKAIEIINSPEGIKLLDSSKRNTMLFKEEAKKAKFKMASDSVHPIQPVLIGDPVKNRALADFLFNNNILVTNLSYPVVQPGRDEIRIQISAAHTEEEINTLISVMKKF